MVKKHLLELIDISHLKIEVWKILKSGITLELHIPLELSSVLNLAYNNKLIKL